MNAPPISDWYRKATSKSQSLQMDLDNYDDSGRINRHNESIREQTRDAVDPVYSRLSVSPSSSDHEDDSRSRLPLASTDGIVHARAQSRLFDGCIDEEVILDKGRLRTVAFSSVDGETAAVRDRITVQLERRNTSISQHSLSSMVIEACPWQVAMAAEIMLRRDTLLISATGSGKSMCFCLPLIADTTASVLVISPLLALMDDQVGLFI